MTLTDKVKALQEYCATQDSCDKCILNSFGDCRWEGLSNTIIEEMYSKLPIPATTTIEETPEETPIVSDTVNHPNHYTNGGMECIDEMVLLFGKDVVKNFCLCNAWKYRRRAMYKNGEEDMEKSHWYIRKYEELSCSELPSSTVQGF